VERNIKAYFEGVGFSAGLAHIFFLALVQRAGATVRLAGLLTIVGSAVLLAVVLIEGVFTIDLAQAAANGHQVTSLTSFDIMTVLPISTRSCQRLLAGERKVVLSETLDLRGCVRI
jgi:hypothetical protein